VPEISFLHTGFLAAGAAAAALPILIHLLLRQRARTVEIGSVRFLRSVIRQHTRRRRIRQWLLLALRVLALLLLGALFARPFLDRAHLLGLNREVTLLIDRSASMRTRGARGGTLFDQAWQQAKAELEQLDKNTIVRVAMFDAAEVQEIEPKELDAQPATSDAATDYTAALGWARDVLTLSSRPQRSLQLWTDLQQSGLKGRVEGFPEDIEVTIHDIGREMAQNVAVVDVRATAVEIRPGRPVTVTARLHNVGPLPVAAVPVKLQLRGPVGTITAEQTVDLPGGRRQSTSFALDVDTPGLYRGEVSIEHEDDLQCDNRAFVAFEVRHPDRVLLVDGQPGRSVYANETYYLEMALRLDVPTSEASSRTYEVERIIWEDGEGFPDLTGFRVIVLANLRVMTDEDLRRLRQYVAAGGRVLSFAGDQTAPAVVAAMHQAGLAAGNIAISPNSGRLRTSWWERDHAIFQPFADPQHGDLRRLTFHRMLHWETVDSAARVLMRVDDRPLMIEQSLGDGRVVWMGTTADRQWSDWPQDRLFVPLVRQMMAYLTDQLTELQRVQSEVVSRPQERAGIEQTGSVTLVRNLDPRESLLQRITAENFRKTLGLPGEDEDESHETAEAAVPAPKFAQRADEAWPLVMWMLFAVLVGETLLASRVHA